MSLIIKRVEHNLSNVIISPYYYCCLLNQMQPKPVFTGINLTFWLFTSPADNVYSPIETTIVNRDEQMYWTAD